ncbi:MAG: phage holin family protein [Clostridiales bacterium]|nr:phage holin family protein [Clostridiales bacterium]
MRRVGKTGPADEAPHGKTVVFEHTPTRHFHEVVDEGVSLLENAAHLGLPVPEKLKAVLSQLHDKDHEDESKT